MLGVGLLSRLCRAHPASFSWPPCRSFILTAVSMAKAFVDEEIKKPVVVFSKTYCPFCKMAKDTLNSTGAKFEVIELDERRDGDAIQDYLLELTGERTVPRVFIKGQCIGGGSETRNLHQQNKLVPLLKDAGAIDI